MPLVLLVYTSEWNDTPRGLINYINTMHTPPYTQHTVDRKAIAILTQHDTTAIATAGTQMLLTQVLSVSAIVLSA